MPDTTKEETTEVLDRRALHSAMIRLARQRREREADVKLSDKWSPMPAAKLAALLPKWQVSEYVGSGFMAAVYRGRQQQPSRDVAIKVLRPELRANEEALQRFRREGEILAKFAHTHVVSVLEYGNAGEDESAISYLVMPYVSGTPLSEIIHHTPVPVPRALSLTRQMLEGLAHIHRQGICHRDLKPSNTMIQSGDIVVIIDFGIAHLNERIGGTQLGDTTDLQTEPGVRLGTPRYLAPELMCATGTASAVTDIYALGRTLADMLTGMAGMTVPMPTPALQAIVEKACHPAPDQRYQTAAEMLAALEPLGRRPPLPPAEPENVALPRLPSVKVVPVLGRVLRACFATRRRTLLMLAGAGLWWLWPRAVSPATASVSNPYVNSLGMEFVRVPGWDVAIAIRRVTRRDYARFVDEVGGLNDTWRTARFSSVDPEPADDAPVCAINELDAGHFCTWLSKREHSGLVYRLPTSDEWRAAMARKWQRSDSDPFQKKNVAATPEQLAEARYMEHWHPLTPSEPTYLGLQEFSLADFEWAHAPNSPQGVVLSGYFKTPEEAIMLGFETNNSDRNHAGGTFTLKATPGNAEKQIDVVPWFYFRVAIDLPASGL